MNKTILITGAAGFIGRKLCDKLSSMGENLIQIDNLSEEPLLKPHQDLIIDDVENISHEFLKKNNISEIVHLAAKKNVKDSFYNLDNSVENYEMTLKLYDSAIKAGVQKIYLASTCEIFGYQEKPLSEKFNFKPHSPYAVSKVANEYLSDVFMMLNQNLLITSLNFFNTYGPTEGKDAVIPNFISKAMNKELILIEGDGNQSRDFTYIDDTIDLLVKIFQNDSFYRSINIGSGEAISINQLLSYIKEHFPDIKYEYVDERPNEIKSFIADNSFIRKNFNFKPGIKIREGIEKIISFYKN